MKTLVIYRKGEPHDVYLDDADFERLSHYKWFVTHNAKQFYVSRNVRGGKMVHSMALMHHDIIGKPPKGGHVDHINGNGRDNRRCNLRMATHSQNLANRGLDKNNKSGFKGVCWDSENKKWLAHITCGNKYKNLGRFVNKDDAARAYDAAARKHFGEFAFANFPEIGRANN